VSTVWQVDTEVVVSLEPPSVIRFADDALQHGWADDEHCARLTGDLG
jgi:hypothetical protein